jgi:hypothetical protein
MRKATIILNWLVLLILFVIFILSLSKAGGGASYIGSAIGIALFAAPFFVSLRALRKGTIESAKSAITPNYVIAGFMVLLFLYVVLTSWSFAFLPLAVVIIVPAFMNIRLLKAQSSDSI